MPFVLENFQIFGWINFNSAENIIKHSGHPAGGPSQSRSIRVFTNPFEQMVNCFFYFFLIHIFF